MTSTIAEKVAIRSLSLGSQRIETAPGSCRTWNCKCVVRRVCLIVRHPLLGWRKLFGCDYYVYRTTPVVQDAPLSGDRPYRRQSGFCSEGRKPLAFT